MFEWAFSPEEEAGYLDLRGDELSFGDAERLLDTIQPYYPGQRLKRIILDVRGLDPLPGPVAVLVVGIEAQAEAAGVRVEVVREDLHAV
jgi:hypothetical protein